MNREQAENMLFRLTPENIRGTYPNGTRWLRLSFPGAGVGLLAPEYIRNDGEVLPLNRLSDDELRALLPKQYRELFKSEVAA